MSKCCRCSCNWQIDSLVSPDKIACIDAMVSLVLWYPLWDNIVHKMDVQSHVIHTPSACIQLYWAAHWTQLEQLFSSSLTNLPIWRLEVEIRKDNYYKAETVTMDVWHWTQRTSTIIVCSHETVSSRVWMKQKANMLHSYEAMILFWNNPWNNWRIYIYIDKLTLYMLNLSGGI